MAICYKKELNSNLLELDLLDFILIYQLVLFIEFCVISFFISKSS